MAFKEEQLKQIKDMLDQFIEEHRPPVEFRPQLDIGWKIVGQSVHLFEIRPKWDNPKIYRQHDYAKATWVQSQQVWKIYWKNGNLKWDPYPPLLKVGNLKRFLIETEKDPAGCFKG